MLIDAVQFVSCCHFYLGTPPTIFWSSDPLLSVYLFHISSRAGSYDRSSETLEFLDSIAMTGVAHEQFELNQSVYSPF